MLRVYTDGACRGNGKENAVGGWAWAAPDTFSIEGKYLFNSGGEANTTNNRMELMAVINALDCLSKEIKDITIYTDSAYLHNCYKQKWYVNWQKNGWKNAKKEQVKNQDLWERLIPYFENPSIHFEKVKGHANDEFNNLVDELAVAAALKVKEK